LVDRATQSNGGTDRLPNSERVLAFPVALRQPRKGRKTRAFRDPGGISNALMTASRIRAAKRLGNAAK
jgi:hypothetical protein